jgi:hypothetical protein
VSSEEVKQYKSYRVKEEEKANDRRCQGAEAARAELGVTRLVGTAERCLDCCA